MARQTREQKTTETREGTGRRARVPMNAMQQKLQVRNKRSGYVQRWFNDDHGRIAQAKAAGYEFVEDESVKAERAGSNNESDDRICFPAGTRRDGTPMNTFLMEIPEEFYNEDQLAKQHSIDQVDEAIKGGTLDIEDPEHSYVPKGGIKIKRLSQG